MYSITSDPTDRWDREIENGYFEHLDTRNTYTYRGRRSENIIFDEFTTLLSDVMQDWVFFENNGKIEIQRRQTSDLGEFLHTQELSDFLESLK